MALSHEDIRAVFSGGGASATNSPLSAMRSVARTASSLLTEQQVSNDRTYRILKESRDLLKDMKAGGGGGGGLNFMDVIEWKLAERVLGGLKSVGARGLAKVTGLGTLLTSYGRNVAALTFSTANGIMQKGYAAIQAAGSPVMRTIGSFVRGSTMKVISSATKAMKWTGDAFKMLTPALNSLSLFGGSAAKIGGLLAKASPILKMGSKIISKVFLPIQAIISVIDAVSGWRNADQLLGRTADFKGKVAASIGSVVSGLTFGISDKITQWFGIQNTSQAIDAGFSAVASMYDTVKNGVMSLGSRVANGLGNVLSWVQSQLPSLDTITSALANPGQLMTNFLNLPGQMFENVVNYVIENFPSVTDLAIGLRDKVWNSVTGLFDSITNKVTGALDDVQKWWNGEGEITPDALTDRPKTVEEMERRVRENLRNGTGMVQAGLGVGLSGPSSISMDSLNSDLGPTALAQPTLQSVQPATTNVINPQTPWFMTEEGGKYFVDKISNSLSASLGDVKPIIVNPLTTPGELPATTMGQTPANDNRGGPGQPAQPAPQELPAAATGAAAEDAKQRIRDYIEKNLKVGEDTSMANFRNRPMIDMSGGPGGMDHRTVSGGSTTGSAGYTPGAVTSGTVSGEGAHADVVNAMMSAGLDRKEAAAIAGNMGVESQYQGVAFNPNAVGDNGSAYGLMQWRGQRRQNLEKWAAENGLDYRDRKVQARFAVEETKPDSPYRDYGSVAALKWMRENPDASVGDMAFRFMKDSERPNMRYAHADRRAALANQYASLPSNDNANVAGSGSNVTESQDRLAGIRKGDIDPELKGSIGEVVYRALGEGYRAEVYSGGQAEKGSGGPRTGSTRHDKGKAGDLKIYGPDGKQISQAQYAKVAQLYLAEGRGGVGMQMSGGGIHLDKHKDRARTWNYDNKGGIPLGREARAMIQAGLDGVMPDGVMSKEAYAAAMAPKANVDTATLTPQNLKNYVPDTGIGRLLHSKNRMTAAQAVAAQRASTVSGFSAGVVGSGISATLDSPVATPKVSAGLDKLKVDVPKYTTPPPQKQAEQKPSIPPQSAPYRDASVGKIKTMDELDMMLYNTSLYG